MLACTFYVMAKSKKPIESVGGSFTAIPHRVMDSVAFMGASDKAKSLLYALMRQHNGSNNGRLHLASSWLKKHGWPSVGSNLKARDELISRSLIIETRKGGLNMGADWFALSWLDVSNYVGLDITASTYQKGKYTLCDAAKVVTKTAPDNTGRKRKPRSDYRSSTVPTIGSEKALTVPTIGTKNDIFQTSTVPTIGNDVYIPLPTSKLQAATKNKLKELSRC